MNIFQELKERKVLDKDGKVDALGPYGRQKLTGQEVAQYFKKNKVKDSKVLYGGSVNSKNINLLKKIDNVDGFLVGGSSQNSNNFIDIIKKTFN